MSADFVGRARRLRHEVDPAVAQIYVSVCSGDVTAGKYNDGTDMMRPILADRLHKAKKAAWNRTVRTQLTASMIKSRTVPLVLPFNNDPEFSRERLLKVLHDKTQPEGKRILAAMSLSSFDRVERGEPINLVCADLSVAWIVLMPGESFLGYQQLPQTLSGDVLTMSIGYGEC